MAWVKLDDQFPDHPKVARAGGDAAWLHVCALCYCGQHLTDGLFPKVVVSRLSDRKKPTNLAARLVLVGMWIDRGDEYEIHDYLKFNPSREQVLADRQRRSEAGAKGAAARWHGKSHDNGSSNGTDNVDAPVPSPSPEPLTLCAPEARAPFDEDFTAWYAAYPNKRAKPDAFNAYKARRRAGETAETLTGARDNLLDSIDRGITDLEFVPYPATFLRKHLDDFRAPRPGQAPKQKPQDLAGPRPCSKCGQGKFLPGSGWVERCACMVRSAS